LKKSTKSYVLENILTKNVQKKWKKSKIEILEIILKKLTKNRNLLWKKCELKKVIQLKISFKMEKVEFRK